ncbi:hypothetical protein PISMIDRAFT_350242 [Pisolithus microcarpus 441]|uniref:Uncharacterized protein n=1 Tax=Pisolithus microcarpus 441 TaxID=765257 RepID=A0A0C9YL43_9AGAM|nr:hypothetical protein BKA83DRAFT_350242 [Pisolithus microcarpus]KIK14519.1 hypothetical protein PISMIDRAFT_350242 [Pisolithus microcarpus 441]
MPLRESRQSSTRLPCSRSCRPAAVGLGLFLCQMPPHADVCQVVSAMSGVIMRLPLSSPPWDTCIRQAILASQVALAVCMSPSGARKTRSLENRSVCGARYNNQKQPNSKGHIPASLICHCAHLDLCGGVHFAHAVSLSRAQYSSLRWTPAIVA